MVKFCKSYNIQIDNLCQFLPQDKVAEFAKITPPDRLKETLRAAAPPEMLENHEKLKQLGKRSTQLEGNCEHHSKELERLTNRQQMDQAQVDRLLARKETMVELERYQNAMPIVEYNISQRKAKEAKKELKQAYAYLRQMEAEHAPTLALPDRKKEYLRKVTAAMKARSAALNQKKQHLDNFKKEITGLVDEIKDLDDKMEAETTAQEKRGKEMEAVKKAIDKIMSKLDSGPPPSNYDELNERGVSNNIPSDKFFADYGYRDSSVKNVVGLKMRFKSREKLNGGTKSTLMLLRNRESRKSNSKTYTVFLLRRLTWQAQRFGVIRRSTETFARAEIQMCLETLGLAPAASE